MFVVQDLKEFNVGDDGNGIWKIMVVLKFKRIYLDPGGNIQWKSKSSNRNIERPGPPHQYSIPKKTNNNKKNVESMMKLPQQLPL